MKITLSGAGKRFGYDWIFRKLNFKFLPGLSYAITGTNGSGKSTLLQIISSAIQLNEGAMQWQKDEHIVAAEEVHEHISFCAPYLELIEEFTAKEFLQFHFSFKKKLNHFSVDEILQKMQLHHAATKQIRFFSSGMKQRLKLAQAFFAHTPVLLLDEPCTNLDESGYRLYYNLINEFAANRLIIVSSNDIKEYSFCKNHLNIQDYKS